MGSRDESQTIYMVELMSDFVAEKPAGATWTDSPRLNVFRI